MVIPGLILLIMEVVILNIAYTAGVFSPTLFTMLVLMALVTTAAITPVLNLLHVGGQGARVSSG